MTAETHSPPPMIGAGGAVALVAVIGAGGLTIRRRRQMEPAAPAQS